MTEHSSERARTQNAECTRILICGYQLVVLALDVERQPSWFGGRDADFLIRGFWVRFPVGCGSPESGRSVCRRWKLTACSVLGLRSVRWLWWGFVPCPGGGDDSVTLFFFFTYQNNIYVKILLIKQYYTVFIKNFN